MNPAFYVDENGTKHLIPNTSLDEIDMTPSVASMRNAAVLEKQVAEKEIAKMNFTGKAGSKGRKDLFISHASEDKDELVRPLAKRLEKAGVDVWYDEYAIKPGDSLSASIDKGLIECQYGLIILSPAFLEKKWTDYELKSLLAKEIHQGKTIIPVWHGVDYEAISKRSLYLADKKALNSADGIENLAIEIIKEVRPDILNSYTLKYIDRIIAQTGRREKRALSSLIMGDIVHESLPLQLVLASKIIDSAFPGISSFYEMLNNFMRDYDYNNEYAIWCIITSAYLDTMYALKKLPGENEMRTMLHYLITVSMGDMESCENSVLSAQEKDILLKSYYKNASILFPVLKGDAPCPTSPT